MKKRFYLIPIIIVLAALAVRIGILIAKGSGDKKRQNQMASVAVEVDSVRFGPIREIREFTGSVYPYNQYVVAPKVSGRVIEIRKRIGDRVSPGELIARIDDAEYQQAVREAEANLKIAVAAVADARSQLELARDQKERMESLRAKELASNAEVDGAVSDFSAKESRYRLAEAQVEQREASLESSKIRFGYTRLTASRAGYIGERFVDEGSLLAPNAAVVSIIEIGSIIVRTTITERDYRLISPGQPADVTVDAFASRVFSGRVARIAPMLLENSRVAQMEVEVRNDSLLLKPGMFARVRVMIASKTRAQIVPARSIVNRNGETGIYMVPGNESIARYVPVKTGIATPDLTEILSPVLEGRAVTLGQHLLEDGSPVLLPNSSSGKAPDPAKGTKEKSGT
ncbi:MAG: efflux RND transporter periplasmic adaptor subunit [Candidatus Krumholzibacteriia bacterium]